MPRMLINLFKSLSEPGLGMIVSYFLVLTLIFGITLKTEQQFSYLARSFLAGKTFFLEKPGTWADAAYWEGKFYRSSGPLPAVILMPFVFVFDKFGLFFYQGYLQFFLVLGVLGFVFVIARRIGWSNKEAILLSFAFGFATSFLGLALWPWGWMYAQVVCVFLWWWIIYEFTNRKRYWLIGILFGLMFLTRATAAVGVVFFVIAAVRQRVNILRNLFWLLMSLVAAYLINGGYNLVRFGSFNEAGQSGVMLGEDQAKAREYGVFSIYHLPGNIYYSLIAVPEIVLRDGLSKVLKPPFVVANQWGMSIFFVSPFLLYLFAFDYSDWESKILLFTVGLIALCVYMFFSTGYRQFGSRYSLDFLPLLYWMYLKKLKLKTTSLSVRFMNLIYLWSFVDLYFFMTVYFVPK